MGGWTEGQMDGKMLGWMGAGTGGRTDRWVHGWADGQMGECASKWADTCTRAWTHGRTYLHMCADMHEEHTETRMQMHACRRLTRRTGTWDISSTAHRSGSRRGGGDKVTGTGPEAFLTNTSPQAL